MTEHYYVVQAENGYYVSLESEGETRDILFDDFEEFCVFMAKTLTNELEKKGKVNVYTSYN